MFRWDSRGGRQVVAWLGVVLGWIWVAGCGDGRPMRDGAGALGRAEVNWVEPAWGEMDPAVGSRVRGQWEEVKRNPGGGAGWGRLGMLLQAYDYMAHAAGCYSNAMRLDAVDVRWSYYLAQMPSWVTAAGVRDLHAESLKRSKGELPVVLYRYAAYLAEEGDWAGVLKLMESQDGVSRIGEYPPARLLWVQALMRQGMGEKAEALARELVRDPATARGGWGVLMQLAQRRGDVAGAAEAARQQGASPPSGPVADPLLDQIAGLREDPQSKARWLHGMLAEQRMGEAEPAIVGLVEKHPQFAEGWLLLGRMQLMKGQLGEAEVSLRKCVGLEPDSVQGWFQLGMVELRRERWGEAVVVFRRATDLKPGFGPAWYNLGYALAKGGDKVEAISAFEKAIRFNPENVDSYVLLADLYRQSGRGKEMGMLLDQAEALKPGDRRVAQLRKMMMMRR